MQQRALDQPQDQRSLEHARSPTSWARRASAACACATRVTGEERDEPFEGLFVAIGHKPNTDVFRDWLEVDAKGYLVVHDHTRTTIDGVFVAGDVHDHRYRQAVTAAGDGCKAAIDAERWLEEQAEPPRTRPRPHYRRGPDPERSDRRGRSLGSRHRMRPMIGLGR